MRRPFLFVALLALVPPQLDAGTVRIVDVGLRGYYAPGVPSRVRVLLLHPEPKSEGISLRVRVRSYDEAQIEHVDTFTESVMFRPGEQRIVDVPVLISPLAHPSLEVEELDARGVVLARDAAPLEPPLDGNLIAILCVDDGVCRDAQTQISFSGSPDERTAKGKALKFVALKDAPAEWWGFLPASTVILAAPLAGLARFQRQALEDFLRQGRQLIVIQDQARDPVFLAAYHRPAVSGWPERVSAGKLYWVTTLRGPELGTLFSGPAMRDTMRVWQARGLLSDELTWVRKRLATVFRFPRLGWLLGWLAAYVLIVGLLNFGVLHRIGRREWGWVTMPAIALLFAAGMYASSAAKRPHDFRADQVTLFWMDEHSPVAAAEIGERVSSPTRRTVELAVPGDHILLGDRNSTGASLLIDPFGSNQAASGHTEWNVCLDATQQVELRMLQWSFRDLEFATITQMPGTVRRAANGRLLNETGRTFREALYVDERNVHFLGAVASGAAVDLAKARQSPLDTLRSGIFLEVWGLPNRIAEVSQEESLQEARESGKETQTGANADTAAEMKEMRELPGKPFELVELVRNWPRGGGHAFDSRSGIFFGLTEEPDPPVDLSGVRFTRSAYSVTIVSFERQR